MPFTGTCITRWPDGNIAWQKHFLLGLPDSTWLHYDTKGNLRARCQYATGLKSGKWEYYNAEGVVISEGSYAKDQKEGCWSHYTQSNLLRLKEFYHLGLLDSAVAYYGNGFVKDQTSYHKGKKHGEYLAFDTKGRLTRSGWYKNDFADSVWTDWAAGVQIKRHAFFQQGVPRDSVYTYSNKGNLKEVEVWKDGELDQIINYDKNGHIVEHAFYLPDDRLRIEIWRKGKIVSSKEIDLDK